VGQNIIVHKKKIQIDAYLALLKSY